MLIHKTMTMPTSCLSCWIAPTCEVWVREKSKYKGYDDRLDECPLEEVKHGHWVEQEHEDWKWSKEYRCSECGKYRLMTNPVGREWDYCPSCGAKMDEVEDGKID